MQGVVRALERLELGGSERVDRQLLVANKGLGRDAEVVESADERSIWQQPAGSKVAQQDRAACSVQSGVVKRSHASEGRDQVVSLGSHERTACARRRDRRKRTQAKRARSCEGVRDVQAKALSAVFVGQALKLVLRRSELDLRTLQPVVHRQDSFCVR